MRDNRASTTPFRYFHILDANGYAPAIESLLAATVPPAASPEKENETDG
jgi:hypothetical protein